MELKVVLNKTYGGFGVDEEMSLWLHENKNWKLLPESDYNYKEKYTNTIVEGQFGMYLPNDSRDLTLRQNPDLIECVETLRRQYEDKENDYSYSEWRRLENTHKCLQLEVIKIKLSFEIDDYDGIETMSVTGYEE